MPNNNVAIISLMAKCDEKSVKDAAQQFGKSVDDINKDIGKIEFGEVITNQINNAVENISKLKGVNLSSYTNNLLTSLITLSSDEITKEVKEASEKAIKEAVDNISILSGTLKGYNESSLKLLQPRQLDSIIEKQKKITEVTDAIESKEKDLNKTANNISGSSRNISTLKKTYLQSDYEKSNEKIEKLLSNENKLDDSQKRSVKHLSEMLALYTDISKVKVEEGSSDAIKYSKDLLTVVREIQKTSKNVDLFSNGGASDYVSKNYDFKGIDEYFVQKAKNAYVAKGLSGLKTRKLTLEKGLKNYIGENLEKSLDSTTKKVEQNINKIQKKSDSLNETINNLKSKSSDKPIIDNIIDISQYKTLEDIEGRLYEINDLDEEGESSIKDLKEYIVLYQKYQQLISSDKIGKEDSFLKDLYDDIIIRNKELKNYTENLKQASKEKQELAETDNSSTTSDINNQTKQLEKQEEQTKEVIKSQEQLNDAQNENNGTGGTGTYSGLESDINEIKLGLNEVKQNISSLSDSNSFTEMSSQIKDVSENIDILTGKIDSLYSSLKNTKEISSLDVLMHGGNLDILNSSDYKKSDALQKTIRNIFTGFNYGMMTGGGIFGTNNMSGISKSDVNPDSKWYAIDFSKYKTYMVETNEEAQKLLDFMTNLNLMIIKNLGVDGKYVAPTFSEDYQKININELFTEYQASFNGANLSLDEFKNVINQITNHVRDAGFELYDDDSGDTWNGKIGKISDEHAYDANISEMFYKAHGYQGINLQKLKGNSFNSFIHGSTIFDIDKDSPYYKVFDTYEEAVSYMKQIRDKINSNQTVFIESVDKSNKNFKQNLEQNNKLLQEQSALIDENQNKLSNLEKETATKGEIIKVKGFHGSKAKWDSNDFDFKKSGRNRASLGAGMYFTTSADGVSNFGKVEIKELDTTLDGIFIITKDYVTSFEDLYKAMNQTVPENVDAKKAVNDIRNFNNTSQENAQFFRENMLEMGYKGSYVGDALNNKKYPEELVIYDANSLKELKSFTNNEFQELKKNGNIEIHINTNVDEVKEELSSSDAVSNDFDLADNNLKTDSNDIKEITDVSSVIESQEELQAELKETDDTIQKILYHYGTLSSYNNGQKSHQFGDEIVSYEEGNSNGGRGWADGTGTYVTNDTTEFNKITNSEDFKNFFALDASKLKMYEAHLEEDAQKFYEFQHKLEQLVLALGSGYTGFDDNISDVTTESLYQEAQSVFSKYPEMFNKVFKDFESFNLFIDEMINLVSKSGINKKGFDSKNAKKLMEFKKEYGVDDIKTRFLKKLGFQGTDLSGTSYGGLQSGSVIFDIDTSTIIAKGETIQEVLDKIGVKAEDTKYKVSEVVETVDSQKQIQDIIQIEAGSESVAEIKEDFDEIVKDEAKVAEGFQEIRQEAEKTENAIFPVEEISEELEAELNNLKPINIDSSQDTITTPTTTTTASSTNITKDIENTNESLKEQVEILDKVTEKGKEARDIISQIGKRELSAVEDDNGNIVGYQGQYSYVERLQDGQLKNVLVTYNDKTNEWEESILSISTAFEKVGNEIIKLDNEQNRLEMNMSKTLSQHPNYDTSADEKLIDLVKQRRTILENTLKVYATESTYEYESEKFEERRLENNQKLLALKERQSNVQTVKNDESVNKAEQKRLEEVKKTTIEIQKQQAVLKAIEATYNKSVNPNLDRSVNDGDDLIELKRLQVQISQKITNLSGQRRDEIDSEVAEIKILIGQYKQLAKDKLKANNPSKQELGGQNLKVLLAQQVASYNQLITKAEEYGNETSDIVERLKEQRDLIAEINSDGVYVAKTGLDADIYYTARDEYKINKAELNSYETKIKSDKKSKTSTDTDIDKVEEQKKAYEELTNAIKEYSAIAKRISSGKALDGDIKKAGELETKISKLQKQPILSQEQINASEQKLVELFNTLDTLEKETSQKSVSKFENSLNKYNNKLLGYQTKSSSLQQTGWASTEFINNINAYKTAIENLEAKINELKANPSLFNDEARKDLEDLDKKAKDAGKQLENMSASQKGFKFADGQAAIRDINKILKENSAMSKTAKDAIKAYIAEINSGNPSASLDVIRGKILQIVNAEEAAGRAGKGMFDAIKDKAFYGVASAVGTYFGMNDIFRYVREGISVVTELDTALTEMRKVSDESTESLKRYQETTFDVAKAVGTTAEQIQNSTADWMRLGESIDDAAESAKVSNILLNVSEFESIDEATEALTAMSQAYQELDKIEIVDVLNNVGNNFSISTDGLATALQKSASALKTVGVDLNEASALITAGNAVVQDPDSVGAGMRTIALRLVGTEAAQEELSDLGEDTDGMITTVSKLRDTIKSATAAATNDGQGFDILDDNGNYKSTYEIMEGLSSLYDDIVAKDKELGTNNLNLLLETIAGKNRSNIAASILQNHDLLVSVYESASQDSEGSAEEELNKYLDSIEGKIQILSNSAQQFWATVIDSETIKDGIDLLTNLLDIINKIVDAFGILPTLAGVGGIGAFIVNFAYF